jgi:hypothetical protein
MENEKQILIIGQGRSGTTLLLRILNKCPDVYISGENHKCLDVLKKFYDMMDFSITNGTTGTEFMKWSWKPACTHEHLLNETRKYVRGIFNPCGRPYWGFKEVRYGFWNLDTLNTELGFLRTLMPNAKIIFSVRDIRTVSKSSWWQYKDDAVTELLKCKQNFVRYIREHSDHSMLVQYEDMYRGSRRIKDIFDFVDIPYKEEYESPLDVKLG